MNGAQVKDTSGVYFGLGIAAILAGLGLFGYFLATGLLHMTDNFTRFTVPGETDLTLQANRPYLIFREQPPPTTYDQIFLPKENMRGLACHLRDPESDTEVPLQPAPGNFTYNSRGRSGRAILQFIPESSGTYRFACQYEEGKQGAKVILDVGSGFIEQFGMRMLAGLASMFGGAVIGAILLVVAYRIRQKVKRQLLQSGQPLV